MRELRGRPRALLALSWFSLAVALQVSDGHFNPPALLFLIGCATALGLAARERLRMTTEPAPTDPAPSRFDLPRLLPALLMVALLGSVVRLPALYLHDMRFAWAHGVVVLLLAAAVWRVAFGPPDFARHARLVFLGGVAAAIMLRLWLPMASPAPIIDVFVQFQESAQNLVNGLNPYKVQVSDVYRGTENFGYTVFGYSYLPSNLYLQTLGWVLLRDIRYAYVAAELLAAAALYAAARRRGEREIGRWLVLLFFFHPRGLFALEQAWTEPLMVGAYAAVDWLAARRPGGNALAAAYGALLSLKQYLVYFVLHGLILERRPKRLAVAALVAATTAAPFFLADRTSFLEYAVLFQLQTTFRADGLTLSAALFALTGLTVGKTVAAVVGLGVGGFTFARFRALGPEGWRFATVMTTVAMFLVGSQAFCNYYYFVSAMLLFTLAGCEGER